MAAPHAGKGTWIADVAVKGNAVLHHFIYHPRGGGSTHPNAFEQAGSLEPLGSGDTIRTSDVEVPGHHPCLPTLPVGTVTSAAGRRLKRQPEHRMSLEGRCRSVWALIFETGRALAFVMFEAGRAIDGGAIHPELLIAYVGLEPTPPCEDRTLSPGLLP